MTDSRTNFDQFLAAIAAKQPTPGGGAVAAAAGALAAAIGEMVLNYSVGKKGLEVHHNELADALQHLARSREIMLQLLVEDQLAYEALSSAKKQAGGVPLEPVVLAAIRVPQTIAATGASILEQTHRVALVANRWLLSDLAVCAELAMATVRCGIYNVRVNLADVTDSSDRVRLIAWCDDLVARCTRIIRETIPAIWHRIAS